MRLLRVCMCLIGVAPALGFHFVRSLGAMNPATLRRTQTRATAAGDDQEVTVVFGRPDGTAANIVHSLASTEGPFAVRACFHEGPLTPSPSLLPPGVQSGPCVDLARSGDVQSLASALRGASHVVVAADGGGSGGSGACDAWLASLGRALTITLSDSSGGSSSSLKTLLIVCPADGGGGFVEAGDAAAAAAVEAAKGDTGSDDGAADGLLSGAALGESFSMPQLPKGLTKVPDFGGMLAGAVGELAAVGGGGGGGDNGPDSSDGSGSGGSSGANGSGGSSTLSRLKRGYGSLEAAAMTQRRRRGGGPNSSSGSRVIAFTVLKHGRVFGGVPGNEPTPFEGGPLLEPSLNEHYAARAVILSASDAILSTKDTNPLGRVQVRTNRIALAELVKRLLLMRQQQQQQQQQGPQEGMIKEGGGSDDQQKLPPLVTVLNVDGVAPSEEEWAVQFRRLDNRQSLASGVELLRVEFESVPKPTQLDQWLSFDFGPNVLSSISTYTKRFGARPVVAIPLTKSQMMLEEDESSCSSSDSSASFSVVCAVRVRWEDVRDGSEESDDKEGNNNRNPFFSRTAKGSKNNNGDNDSRGFLGDGNLKSLLVGSLLITLTEAEGAAQTSSSGSSSSPPFVLTVSREGPEVGSILSTALPGEEEVLQRLLEGLERSVYAKGLAVRLGTKAQQQAQEAAVTREKQAEKVRQEYSKVVTKARTGEGTATEAPLGEEAAAVAPVAEPSSSAFTQQPKRKKRPRV